MVERRQSMMGRWENHTLGRQDGGNRRLVVNARCVAERCGTLYGAKSVGAAAGGGVHGTGHAGVQFITESCRPSAVDNDAAELPHNQTMVSHVCGVVHNA